jgi:hypothetical protein
MDMLKKLKSLFIVEEEGSISSSQTSEAIQNQENNDESAAPVSTPSDPVVQMSTQAVKNVDPKFIDILMKAIEENNLEGFDYLEFKSSLQSLAKMSMDDATRYQSAMAMAKTLGASPDKILQSANHYLAVLKKESDKFQQAVEGQKAKLDQDQQAGVKGLQQSIVTKEQQIVQLTKEIESEKASLAKMQADIQQGAAKITDTSTRFSQAYNLVKKQITDDISLITTHASKV